MANSNTPNSMVYMRNSAGVTVMVPEAKAARLDGDWKRLTEAQAAKASKPTVSRRSRHKSKLAEPTNDVPAGVDDVAGTDGSDEE